MKIGFGEMNGSYQWLHDDRKTERLLWQRKGRNFI